MMRRQLSILLLLGGGFSWSQPAASQKGDPHAITVSCGDEDPNCEGAAARYRYQQQKAREAAERKRLVDIEAEKIGAHRRAEAEKLVRMKQAADAARKKKPRDPRCDGPHISCE